MFQTVAKAGIHWMLNHILLCRSKSYLPLPCIYISISLPIPSTTFFWYKRIILAFDSPLLFLCFHRFLAFNHSAGSFAPDHYKTSRFSKYLAVLPSGSCRSEAVLTTFAVYRSWPLSHSFMMRNAHSRTTDVLSLRSVSLDRWNSRDFIYLPIKWRW